jgi:hypothetical protein
MIGLTSVGLGIDLQPIAARRQKLEETVSSTVYNLDAYIDVAPQYAGPTRTSGHKYLSIENTT